MCGPVSLGKHVKLGETGFMPGLERPCQASRTIIRRLRVDTFAGPGSGEPKGRGSFWLRFFRTHCQEGSCDSVLRVLEFCRLISVRNDFTSSRLPKSLFICDLSVKSLLLGSSEVVHKPSFSCSYE